MNTSNFAKPINISVVGVSGSESIKGDVGVGKSLLCNRFVRPAADDFHLEHCSVLSQTDFGGSPVINNDHWLYWGDRLLVGDDNCQVLVRVVEQTEFLDDETYEPIASSSKNEDYAKRCCRVQLSSRDKLMYIQKEQLGLEADFTQHVLHDGKFNVDGFVLVCDASRNLATHGHQLSQILTNLAKTKKPVVVALTKSDNLDEEAKKNILQLLSRKELKNVHLPPIEVSAVRDVNIEDVFHAIAQLCTPRTYKHKRKPLPFYEAILAVEQRNVTIKKAYINLLSNLMPMKSWPTQRCAWKHLLSDLDRNRDFIHFVQVYGSRAAYRMYEQYMCDAREHWITARLRAILPSLPRVIAILLEKIDVSEVEWMMARDIIQSHALFDDYFQPIGSLGRQLEPLTPEGQSTPINLDGRLPAEILMLPEAKQVYEAFKNEIRQARRNERLEEEFECLLGETPEVTPGKSLKDVAIFLQGSPAFDNLSPTQAIIVYDRYQRTLVKRAEAEFVECLLEHVEFIIGVLESSSASEPLSIEELNFIKDELEQDRRYRWMSIIFDIRDHLIYSITNFYKQPSCSKCPAGTSRCTEVVVANALDRFFHRRNDHAYTHLIDILVIGENSKVAQFITELSVFLRNEAFPCASGSAYILCYGEDDIESKSDNSSFTEVFLIDSIQCIEELKSRNFSAIVPPVFVVVCEPSNYDMIPMLHQQGASLAAKIGASFFGVRGDGAFPTDDAASTNIASDCSSLLGRDQLIGICDAICSSQLTNRKRDLRVQVSLMCADQYSMDALVDNIFGDFEQIPIFRPIVHPNFTAGGLVPIDVSVEEKKKKLRVELAMCSYHSWLSPSTSYKINATQAHVLVYHSRRHASFAHARTAISRLLKRERDEAIHPACILLVAICDARETQDSNGLLTDGDELCTSIGAEFVVIRGGSGGGGGDDEKLTERLIAFFERVAHIGQMVREKEKRNERDNDGDGYSSLVEHVRPTSLNLTASNTHSANMPFQGMIEKRAGNIANAAAAKKATRPSMLKMKGESRLSRSGPILINHMRKSQPDIQIAPLATPEAVEIAPEYSLVKDALTSEEGIYETLDFGTNNNHKKSTRNGAAMNHLDLPATSTAAIPDSISRRLCRESMVTRRSRTACLSSSPSPKCHLHRTVAHLTPADKILKPIDVIRHSLSAESIVELIKQEKKAKTRSNRFVRKVATSFRFRKDKIEEKRDEGRKSEDLVATHPAMDQIAAFREKMASRSLPQSPHMDRKARIYSSLNSTTEKVSSAFSWLPSRSPKRSHKEKSQTVANSSSLSSSTSTANSAQGVIASEENLETLCAASSSGIPIYVEKCVEFIENNGGFELEGLYRVPGNQAHLADVERKFLKTGEFVVSSVDIPVHVAATALKNFFSCLPSPLIPVETHLDIKRSMAFQDEQEKVAKLRNVFATIPDANRNVLRYLISHLTKVSNSPKTVMDLKNLSKVWFPTLFRPDFDSYEALSSGMAAFQLAMETIFVNFDRIL
ncbi:unnamed protein product [Caenorhabditis bovis]|uniref:Uncharacterized protein n=1 Tax=Caenorhabditis bovis TaxID=2654633 RepID=A0A8S1F9P7_9PELO|nr:unnamed protein product [Caenorhabditis bovis]